MKKQANTLPVEKKKVIAIMVLFITSVLVILSGAALCIFSFVYDTHFTVLTSEIHGAVFGAIVMFLGIRYFLSVRKLKAEVYKTTSKFSWSNFKKQKPHKNMCKSR